MTAEAALPGRSDVTEVIFHQPDGSSAVVQADAPTSVMRLALGNAVPGIVAECGGNAVCATCHVYVHLQWLERLPSMEEDEDVLLDGTASPRSERSRLSCQLVVGPELSGLEVDVPPDQV